MVFKMKSVLCPTKNELYATCVACLGAFLSGVDATFSALLIHQIRNMTVTIREQSLIGSINFYGRAVSSLMITYFLNILGRKNSLLLILVCNISAWVLMYFFSFTMTVVYISRAFSGFASGMRTPITVYITETAHKSRRGIMISILGLSMSLGIAATYTIQYFSSWQIVALIALAISVLGFIQTCFLKETKYWHLYKNNAVKAKQSMKWFDSSLTDAQIEAEIDEILSTDIQSKGRRTNAITSFRSLTNVKFFMFGFFLLTFLFGCGRVQITAHPYNYYIQFKVPVTYSTITLAQGILEVAMSIVCSFTIDTVPRKTMLHFCCWSMNTCLAIVLFHDFLENAGGQIGRWVLLVALLVFYAIACGFLLCLTSIMVAEIVSITTEARAVFQGLLYVWVNLISGAYTQVFPYALVALPVHYVVLFFFVNLALLSFTGFFVPETRGQALHHCSAPKVPKVSNEHSATEDAHCGVYKSKL